ncbi:MULTISPECIES: LysR family transcriptional regulator [Acinetobacter]|jgi:DNA-binding transcriptional LysR family regulator|uniref:LysR family transcriptional regulator n=1 Tax=Acinetobacter TaxID=469 RepID=UPI0004D4A11A|nr:MULTISPECIES: LysR family transcriptional regulator [Acinetobacter]KEC86234.1 LysR family transcriptional regulator [Acinetobacter sp. ETR1]MCG7220861.1 LysR family transcriptional regulator [Acinetobacter sp. AG3]WEE37565.1 LysR family transcriptional regulator [Acinetobacter sp. TAC-1]
MNMIHNKTNLDMSIFNHIDINLYPLFITIYEQRNISKAARILCITQSAASHALQRLRQHLQDDLFVRAGSKMLPTPFAEQIYPSVQNALFAFQNISKQKQQFDPSSVQTLRIAIHDEIEPIIFPKLIHHFQKLNLTIQFLSTKLDRKNVIADLAAQQVDFVIDLEQNYGDKINYQNLVQDHFVICSQHININSELYFASPHIGVSSRRTGLLLEDIYLNQAQFRRQIFMRCQHYSTALQVLAQYPDAMLTIPKQILAHLQVDQSINIFEHPIDLPVLNMGIYWHGVLNENSRHIYLREEISKIFA